MSIKDFAEVKKGITKAQEQLKTTLKKKINSVLGKTGDGSMSIGDIDTLGVFDSSDTSLSFMAVMDQVSRAGGQREVDKQAVISSYLLAQGKLVIVNQYQILNPAENVAEQLGEAKAHAQEILKELNIDHSVPWASYLDSFAGKLVLAALIGGLIGGGHRLGGQPEKEEGRKRLSDLILKVDRAARPCREWRGRLKAAPFSVVAVIFRNRESGRSFPGRPGRC